ncbi:MAG: glycosyltransferase family 4 protein [Dehalococcoidia bacterium]|nr:glycosyltransferase family 4 protein [Dehalococcoidia bacterium]
MLGHYPLRRDHIIGGAEAAVVCLADEMRWHSSLDLQVVTLRPEIGEERVIHEEGYTVHYLPASHHLGNATFHLLDRHRLVEKLRQIRPDLIHAHVASEYAEAAHQSGIPYVLTLHGIRSREAALAKRGLVGSLRTVLESHSERECVRGAKHIISISPYVIEQFKGLIRGRAYEIENPVAKPFFDIDNGKGVPGRILFVGRVIPPKGLPFLIDALASVKERIPYVHLHVAGPIELDPSHFAKMKAALAEQGLAGAVHFLGPLDEERLLKEYACCSIFVLPSVEEVAPIALLQAMAAGKPAIATRVGGNGYLIQDQQTGLLVEPRDPRSLARALVTLLEDEPLATRLGQKARIVARERFHPEQVIRKTLQVYETVLNRSQLEAAWSA